MSETPYHEIGGVLYPRVTEVIGILRSLELERWKERIGLTKAAAIATRTSRVGKAVHGCIEKLSAGKKIKPPSNKVSASAWQTWQQWASLQQQGAIEIAKVSEQLLVAKDLYRGIGLSGTPDLVEPALITDWKFTGYIHEHHWIQLHAYVGLVKGFDFQGPIDLRIVRIDPELGMFQDPRRPFDPAILATFFKLFQVYVDWYWLPWLDQRKREAETVALTVF